MGLNNKPGISPETLKLSSTSKRLLIISLVFTVAALIVGFLGYQKFARNAAIQDALNAYHNHNFVNAQYFMTKAEPFEAQHVKFLEFMALSSYRLGLMEEADNYYKKLAKYPEAEQFYNLGMVSLDYYKKGAKSQELLNFQLDDKPMSQIIRGYSLIVKNNFQQAKEVFEAVLNPSNTGIMKNLPGIEECTAAYNGIGVAIARSKDYKNLEIAEYKQAISAFQSAIAYKLPYAAPYANLDRILAVMAKFGASKFLHAKKVEIESDLELVKLLAKTAGIDMHDVRSAGLYFDEISKFVDVNTENKSEASARINDFPVEPLFFNRIKHLYPEIAGLLAKIHNSENFSAMEIAEEFWAVCASNLPEDNQLKYLRLNSLLWKIRIQSDKSINADLRTKIKRLLSDVINSEFFKNLAESSQKKILTAQTFFNQPE